MFPKKLTCLRSGHYSFAAVLQHRGDTPQAGRYTRYVRLGSNDNKPVQFAHCNDMAITTHTWNEIAVRVIQQEACMLVYSRDRTVLHSHDDGSQNTPYQRESQSVNACADTSQMSPRH